MNSFEWTPFVKNFFSPGQCGFDRVLRFLQSVDCSFSTKLSLRVHLEEYSTKLALRAFNLFIAHDGNDIAHAAFYCDEQNLKIFITSLAVMDDYAGKGLGKKILNEIESFACLKKIKIIELETDCSSEKLIDFYNRSNFIVDSEGGKCILKKKIE